MLSLHKLRLLTRDAPAMSTDALQPSEQEAAHVSFLDHKLVQKTAVVCEGVGPSLLLSAISHQKVCQGWHRAGPESLTPHDPILCVVRVEVCTIKEYCIAIA